MGIFNSTGFNDRMRSLWQGQGKTGRGFVKLFQVILGFFLSSWIWNIGVHLAHFRPPAKTIGVVLALGTILLIIWSIWGFGKAVLLLGIRRLVFTILVMFMLLVVTNILTISDTRPLGTRIITQLSASVQQVGTLLADWARSGMQAPDDFLFAYSGRRNPSPLPPGFPTPDLSVPPIQVSASGSETLPVHIPTPLSGQAGFPEISPTNDISNDTMASSFVIGGYVKVVRTGGQPLRARDKPGTAGEIVARFPEGTVLLILEGPIEKDGYVWWKVRSEDEPAGWCADRWLEPQ